jgi:hypothetical protein
MRTTVTLDRDALAAVLDRRREKNIGVSQAVNELIRASLALAPAQHVFVQQTAHMGPGLDVTNIGELLETLDGPAAR